eukprot:TRINITY_DN5665_c0_g3_i7.p1 TRINITY_DN5665_c0_g3~~TRINITY_DN5665_c0_g3_i7.p1  ORF type:complete len:397 (+),score=66.41 TRINITY_DN5665_c0_g3_i7:136-1326(+)
MVATLSYSKKIPKIKIKKIAKYKKQPEIDPKIQDVTYSPTPNSEKGRKLLHYSAWYGRLLHQKAPGYLSNLRQQKMAGLAVVQVAQTMRDFWFHGKITVQGSGSSFTKAVHPFGWRDLYDIIVRWRQISEPNDPVWWVDALTKEQFTEGFGSHTPMITGQCNVVRYSPMVVMSFPIMKREILLQKTLSPGLQQLVRDAKDVEDLYNVMKRDFWVVTPCHSLRTDTILEGTRLTLQSTEPEGYEFSIRTPGTPPRWMDYDQELAHILQLLTEAVKAPNRDLEKVGDLILTLSFYWYNFMPLSRGTAACGYIALVGLYLAVGLRINTMVPPKFLVDWEAILRPRPEDFIAQIKPWLSPSLVAVDMAQFDELPSVEETFPTIRSMIEILNCDIEKPQPL